MADSATCGKNLNFIQVWNKTERHVPHISYNLQLYSHFVEKQIGLLKILLYEEIDTLIFII